VPAGEGGHGTNGSPGFLYLLTLYLFTGRLARHCGSVGTVTLPEMTASATARMLRRRSIDVF
jgi:hypothetical protein